MVSNKACYVIAEAGVNHNGDLDTALRMVVIAADCGADAVKFQSFIPELLVSREARTVAYQRESTGIDDQLSMLRRLVLAREHHAEIRDRCLACGIDFLSTGFDEDSIRFLVDEVGVRRIKIPSGEITNIPLLEMAASTGLPIILSTGMSDLEEVHNAIDCIIANQPQYGFHSDIAPLTVLHCTSNYPTEIDDVNLLAMSTMAATFGLPVGYSDHTTSTIVPALAVARGAIVIEKHFTLDRQQEGPDHKASLEPDELREMIANIRLAEQAMGKADKMVLPCEISVRDQVRKSIALRRNVAKGVLLREDDLVMLRPGTGIPPTQTNEVIGRRAARNLQEGMLLQWEDLY